MNEIFNKVDVILVKSPDTNFFYFTQLEGMWEGSYVVVFPDDVKVIAPPLEEGEAYFYHNKEEMKKILKEIVNAERIGFNGNSISYRDFIFLKKLIGGKWVDVGKELMEMRAIKRREEIERIKKACRKTFEIMEEIEFNGKKEREVCAEIEYKVRRKGLKMAFDTIVAFGKNTSSPHHIPGTKKFSFPVILDMGIKFQNYCSDITESFVNTKGKRIYEIVDEALHMAIDEIREGVEARNVAKKIEKFLKKNGYGMRHALGHSIGIDVHDGFPITTNSEFVFRENMVFAIEPAVYTKSLGIRLERDIVVGKEKSRIIR